MPDELQFAGRGCGVLRLRGLTVAARLTFARATEEPAGPGVGGSRCEVATEERACGDQPKVSDQLPAWAERRTTDSGRTSTCLSDSAGASST